MTADDELRRDFDEMAALELDPTQFGLRIRNSRLKLNITAVNKMRRSRLVQFSFSGDIPETVAFSLKPDDLDTNMATLESFVRRLGEPDPGQQRGGSYVWAGVSPDDVVENFFDQYEALNRSWRVRPKFISKYVMAAAEQGELNSWTVRLVSSTKGTVHDVAGLHVGLVKRSRRKSTTTPDPLVYSTRRLVSPLDEVSGLTDEQHKRALAKSPPVEHTGPDGTKQKRPATVPCGPAIREQRDPNEPLLLIYVLENPLNAEEAASDSQPPVVGFAISFPLSPNTVTVEYRVNEIWTKQELDEYFDEDEA